MAVNIPKKLAVRREIRLTPNAHQKEVAVLVAASATTMATTAVTSATATTTWFAWLGFIDSQWTPTMIGAIERLNCCRSCLFGSHLYKPKSFAAASLPVFDDLSTYHFTVLREHLFELSTAHVIWQVTTIQILTHIDLQN